MRTRKIKFRGKRVDNGEWVYGHLITNKLGLWIIDEENPHYCSEYGYMEISLPKRVKPETVGQFTGLKAVNGKEIYEGDIVEMESEYDAYGDPYQPSIDRLYTGEVVITGTKGACLKNPKFLDRINDEYNRIYYYKGIIASKCKVIGNIHDNPEQLKK